MKMGPHMEHKSESLISEDQQDDVGMGANARKAEIKPEHMNSAVYDTKYFLPASTTPATDLEPYVEDNDISYEVAYEGKRKIMSNTKLTNTLTLRHYTLYRKLHDHIKTLWIGLWPHFQCNSACYQY